MNLGLSGKCAVVTAGGGAICGSAAIQLAAEGVRVAVWDISLAAAEKTATNIRSAGGEAVAVCCDGTDDASVSRATEVTLSEFGQIDLLVNGTGGSRPETTTSGERSFFDIDPVDMDRVMALNYSTAVTACRHVARDFVQRGSGAVVNVASIAGLSPLSRALSYSDGKAALVSFTRWLAVELAREYGPGIRVNAVAPGFVITDQNRFLLETEHGELTDRGRTVLSQVPSARFGEADEIGSAIVYLASDRASFVTGSVLVVDGGYTAFSGV